MRRSWNMGKQKLKTRNHTVRDLAIKLFHQGILTRRRVRVREILP